MKPTIELRKISHNASLSEETFAYTAQVWANGVHICDVSNHGHGGCDMQYPAKGKTHKDVTALNDLIKATFPKEDTGMELDGKPFIMEPSLESVCHGLVSEWLIEKDLKRLLKRTVAFMPADKNEVRTYKGKIADADRPKYYEAANKQYPNARILNTMPFADALALYRKSAA